MGVWPKVSWRLAVTWRSQAPYQAARDLLVGDEARGEQRSIPRLAGSSRRPIATTPTPGRATARSADRRSAKPLSGPSTITAETRISTASIGRPSRRRRAARSPGRNTEVGKASADLFRPPCRGARKPGRAPASSRSWRAATGPGPGEYRALACMHAGDPVGGELGILVRGRGRRRRSRWPHAAAIARVAAPPGEWKQVVQHEGDRPTAREAADDVEAAGRTVEVAGKHEVGGGGFDRRLDLGERVGPFRRFGPVAQAVFGDAMARERQRGGEPPLRDSGAPLRAQTGERHDRQARRRRRPACPEPLEQNWAADPCPAGLGDRRPGRRRVRQPVAIEGCVRPKRIPRPEDFAARERCRARRFLACRNVEGADGVVEQHAQAGHRGGAVSAASRAKATSAPGASRSPARSQST